MSMAMLHQADVSTTCSLNSRNVKYYVMLKKGLLTLLCLSLYYTVFAQTAHWITADHADRDVPNTWIEFQT